MITSLPNGVQYVPVSTTTCPVTVTAEVAVKNATIAGAPPSPRRAIGNASRSVPAATAKASAAAASCAGCRSRTARSTAAPTRCTRPGDPRGILVATGVTLGHARWNTEARGPVHRTSRLFVALVPPTVVVAPLAA
ncbi:MAG TPA: hypothetical protein VKP11_10860, partial [Frankiaceae bacterium]|nr:hypothetical protein [Frankiaceae bacterium]